MRIVNYLLSSVLFLLVAFFTNAQKKIVVMGSSTAAGSNASTYANSWVGKMTSHFRQNMSDGADTVVYNIAQYGYATYHEMPGSFVPPLSRPSPDPAHNVTMALSHTPHIVIINLPSNDIAFGYTKKEMMDNLRLMYNTITATGARCFIGTTAPRNDLTAAQRLMQRELVDSIHNNFGVFVLNFWDDLVTNDGQNRLRDEVRDPGSDYHINDLGHNYLYLRVRDKQIFTVAAAPLPLQLTGFDAAVKNNAVVLQWKTEQQEARTGFELQRSSNGTDFETVHAKHEEEEKISASYTHTDHYPLQGKSFYRLKIKERTRLTYSGIVSVQRKESNLSLHHLLPVNSSGLLTADINVNTDQKIIISIFSANGALLHQQYLTIQKPYSRVAIPVGKLATGQYFLQIRGIGDETDTRAFVK